MNEREKAEIRKLNEEIKTLKHERWIKRQELRHKQNEIKLKLYTAATATFAGAAALAKIITDFIQK